MSSSFRDNPYQLPNLAYDGLVPEYPRLPTWLPKTPQVPLLDPRPGPPPWRPLTPPPGPSPFTDPPSPPPQLPPPHEVDPPRLPNSRVTESHLGQLDSAGDLLGLLWEAMRRAELRSEAGLDPILHGVQPMAAQIRSASSPPVRRLVRISARKGSI